MGIKRTGKRWLGSIKQYEAELHAIKLLGDKRKPHWFLTGIVTKWQLWGSCPLWIKMNFVLGNSQHKNFNPHLYLACVLVYMWIPMFMQVFNRRSSTCRTTYTKKVKQLLRHPESNHRTNWTSIKRSELNHNKDCVILKLNFNCCLIYRVFNVIIVNRFIFHKIVTHTLSGFIQKHGKRRKHSTLHRDERTLCRPMLFFL